MKTLLFGVEGLLGSQWLDCLNKMGHEVIGVGPEELVSPDRNLKLKNYFKFDLTSDNTLPLKDLFLKENPINVVINSGKDAKPGFGQSVLTSYSIDSWREILEVNLYGVVRVLNAALDCKSPPRNIVVVGSMYSEKSPNPYLYSHYGEHGLTKHPAYSASKFGALSVVKQYAAHYASKGTLINMISPGVVDSNQDSEFIQKITDKIPLHRLASAEELQSILEFLLEKNSYVVGQNLVLDGGMNLW